MPRKGQVPRREVAADPKYNSVLVTRFVDAIMHCGKRSLAERAFYSAMAAVEQKAGQDAMTQIATQGRERLAQGFWIVVYPEGTRIPVGTRVRYKTGGARLAVSLGAPIVPVAHNAGYLWPKGVLGKRPGVITVSISPTISPEGKDMQQLTTEVETWIENEVARLGNPLQTGDILPA